MDTNKMREQFEAWALTRFINSETMNPLERDESEPEEYRYSMVNMAWIGWQASREAVAVVLPDEEPGCMYYASDVLAAIEAQGLKVAGHD